MYGFDFTAIVFAIGGWKMGCAIGKIIGVPKTMGLTPLPRSNSQRHYLEEDKIIHPRCPPPPLLPNPIRDTKGREVKAFLVGWTSWVEEEPPMLPPQHPMTDMTEVVIKSKVNLLHKLLIRLGIIKVPDRVWMSDEEQRQYIQNKKL